MEAIAPTTRLIAMYIAICWLAVTAAAGSQLMIGFAGLTLVAATFGDIIYDHVELYVLTIYDIVKDYWHMLVVLFLFAALGAGCTSKSGHRVAQQYHVYDNHGCFIHSYANAPDKVIVQLEVKRQHYDWKYLECFDTITAFTLYHPADSLVMVTHYVRCASIAYDTSKLK